MREPSFADAFEVLCLQAAADGRGDVLFGDCVDRARSAMRPFLVGEKFPSVYLEFPLSGDPFLDVTVLYDKLAPETRIESPAAEGSEALLDWFARECSDNGKVSCGFELDTSKVEIPRAAVHFQPREHVELVEAFCNSIGEPNRAQLYLEQANRMPDGWSLSFFGLFRGRPDYPLRVCGYLSAAAIDACRNDPDYLPSAFQTIGFEAYDADLLARVRELMGIGPQTFDFQFDVLPDGTLGETFALDFQYNVEQPKAVRETFSGGSGSRSMQLLESWGIADDRWKLIPDAAFARSIPVEREDGSLGRFSFTLMPGWAKARWRNGVLQPAKFYFFGKAGILVDD